MPTATTVLVLSADDWPRTHFIRCLLWETVHAVRALVHSRHQLHHRAWLESVGQPQARTQLGLLIALTPLRGWVPDFFSRPALAANGNFEDELAVVADHRLELVAGELRRSLDSAPDARRSAVLEPLIADPEAALARILVELRYAWTRLVEPFWPAITDLLDADIAYRSAQISKIGLGATIAAMHSDIDWQVDGLHIDDGESRRIEPAGSGLALMPSAFGWPFTFLIQEISGPPTLAYPVRGVAGLWAAPGSAPAALIGILGRTRALILNDLGQSRTTTGLAARHRLSPAAVSAHLGRLRAAQLIVGQRLGKQVHYRRTALGDQLVQPL